MTIEEKAKAYDEAIKIAKETYNTQPMYRNWLESMFPELQENEIKDMREKLIKAFGSIGKKEWGGVNVKDVIHWLEKQGESYTKKDVDDAYLKGICDAKHELEKQGEQKPADKVEPFDKYEGLTDFERTLADICIGWIGEELGWKQYIKDNADVLLKIAIKKFNSIQDAPFEQKSAAWSDEDEENLQHCCMAISVDSLHTYEDKQDMEAWLKSLKNRIGG